MAAPGKKPQSAKILELKGSYGNHKERLGVKEDSGPINNTPPRYLNLQAAEKKLWRELVEIWWWLPQCTEPALAELCKLMVQSKKYRTEHDTAMRVGDIQAVQVLSRALRMTRRDIKDYLIQFGVTPAERNRFLRSQSEAKPKGRKSLLD